MKVGRTIYPSRPSTTRKKLPRQPAEASGAATPGYLQMCDHLSAKRDNPIVCAATADIL